MINEAIGWTGEGVRWGNLLCGGYYRYLSGLRGSRSAPGEDIAYASYFGSDTFQFFFDVLVAAVQMIDAIDDGLAVGNQGGEDE